MTEREAEAYMRQGESAKGEIFQSRAQKSSPKIPLTNAQTVPGLQDALGMRNSVSGSFARTRNRSRLQRIYELANRRLSPRAAESPTVQAARKVLPSRQNGWGKHGGGAALDRP